MKNTLSNILVVLFVVVTGCCSESDMDLFEKDCAGKISHIQSLYDSKSKSISTKSGDDVFLMSSGDMQPGWTAPTIGDNKETGQEIIEFGIEAQNYYIARYPDGHEVPVSNEMLYVRENSISAEDIFLVYYIPEEDDEHLDLCRLYDNDGMMDGYSGVKIYTTVSGVPVRINKYENGELVIGLYVPSLSEEEIVGEGYKALVDMLGGVTIIQYVRTVSTKVVETYGGGMIASALCVAHVNDPDPFIKSELEEWSRRCNRESSGSKSTDPSDYEAGRNHGGGGGGSVYRSSGDQQADNG